MKIQLLPVFSLALLLFSSPPLSAAPEGQLYWLVETYPDQFFLHNPADTYHGAMPAIDYACRQNSGGAGTYTGTVNMHTSGNNFPAQKGGWCRNQTIIGVFDGAYYSAYSYCNGEKREQLDDSICVAPTPPFEVELNLGPPCPVE